MAAQSITVQFHDQTLTAAVIDGKPYVAMKPICENLGLQ
jgi:prophage antirepressor-like protein